MAVGHKRRPNDVMGVDTGPVMALPVNSPFTLTHGVITYICSTKSIHMKRFFLSLLAVGTLAASAQAQTPGVVAPAVETTEEAAPAADGPVVEVMQAEIDYGTIEQDSEPYRTFKIKNTGNAPLLITNARGSCGCTVPERSDWTPPIAPGETRDLRVRYDTHRIGQFRKRVTLTTNAGEPTILTIKGVVKAPAPEPEAVPAGDQGMFNEGGGE